MVSPLEIIKASLWGLMVLWVFGFFSIFGAQFADWYIVVIHSTGVQKLFAYDTQANL